MSYQQQHPAYNSNPQYPMTGPPPPGAIPMAMPMSGPAYIPTQQQQQQPPPPPIADPLNLGGDGIPYPEDIIRFSSSKIPNHKEIANEGYIPFGCILSPFKGFFDERKRMFRPVCRCSDCGAAINLYCRTSINPSTGEWKCIFCGKKNKSLEYAVGSLDACRELFEETVEYAESVQDLFLQQKLQQPQVHVLVLDVTLKPKGLSDLKNSVVSLISSLPDEARIGLITVGSVVKVYSCAANSVPTADVISGLISVTQEKIETMFRSNRSPIMPLKTCREDLKGIVSSLMSSNTPNSPQDRALGPAIEAALLLIRKSMTGETRGNDAGCNGRIVVCLGGAPTQGPGTIPDNSQMDEESEMTIQQAIEYFKALSDLSRGLGLVIDLFVASLAGVRSDVLEHLVHSNGGAIVLQSSFGPQFAANLVASFNRISGRGGIFDFRLSNGIRIREIIGPLLPLKSSQNLGFNAENVYEFSSVEQRHGISLLLELEDDVPDTSVYAQFVVSFTGQDNQRLTRVITKQLATTGNMNTFLSSIDVDTVTVLLAKEAVVMAKTEDTQKILDQLDAQMVGIAQKYSNQVKLRVGGRIHTFPKDLNNLPENVFMLERGPLLGPILQHEDDMFALRQLFLHANFSSSLRLVTPILLSVSFQQDKEEFDILPMNDLALQSNRVLFLDHHSDIFVWIGSEISEADYRTALSRCTSLIDIAVQSRFPVPAVHILREGESMARGLVCRLIPSHKDEVQEQERWFPQIAALGSAVRAMLVSKFTRTDDMSMAEWLLHLRLDVDSASSYCPRAFHPVDYDPI